jgi:hypothetical protein
MIRKLLLVVISAGIFSMESLGQASISDTTEIIPFISFEYGGYLPGGDLADRFGYINGLGAAFAVKTASNFTFGVAGAMQFGDQIKQENLLLAMRTDRGDILDDNAIIATVVYLQRGFHVTGEFGKIFHFASLNPNSGIHVRVGVGYSSNWIRIENRENTIPQLSDELKTYYDRRKHGILFTQYVGFKFFSNEGLANFHAGFEAMQGINSDYRSYNIDDKSITNGTNLDLYFGLKVGWSILFRRTMSSAYYYN